jgi:tRNA G18 (ribose-2'-O)-methylase SpoU
MLNKFEQIKDRVPNKHDAEIIVACPVMKDNRNISMIARSASCFGASTLIICGNNNINARISRDCNLEVQHRNSLVPALKKLKEIGYTIIGIEQADNAISLFDYPFEYTSTVFVMGNETKGMSQDLLNMMDQVIEIPLFGKPHSMNVAMATSLCLYEFTKQHVGTVS